MIEVKSVNLVGWKSGEDMKGIGRGEILVRICFIKIYFNKKRVLSKNKRTQNTKQVL